jgi:septin 4
LAGKKFTLQKSEFTLQRMLFEPDITQLILIIFQSTVENPAHSDFIKLRTMLISTHMQDLNETTQDVHYENFRAQCISQMQALKGNGKVRSESIKTPTGEIIPNVPIVSETDRLLMQKEEEIRRMQEMLAQMQAQLKKTQSSNNIIDV